ncbi:MAG: acyl--CoA ligase [Bacilli bacterium]|nr:acyl--CoA ligase [Bacilli bacterium]
MSIFDIFRPRKKELHGPWEKYYTEEELNYNIPNITMYEQILLSENKYKNLKAIEYLGRKITYRKLVKNIERAAISFKKLGVSKGDIVTICLPNFPEALYSLYALNKLGAIANMTHPLSSENELRDAVNSTNSTILIMCNQFYNKLEPILNETKLEQVIFVKASDSMNPLLGLLYNISTFRKFKRIPYRHMFMSYKKFISKSFYEPYVKHRKLGKNQPAVIIHSGGTSGTPKNVVIQNRAFILGAKQTGDMCLHLKPGDSCLAIMPNFHGFGLSVCMHTALTLGCYTTLVPQFDAKKFDILFSKTKPTVVLGVPTLFEALINNTNIPDIDLSYLKFVVSGGDTLPKTLEDRVNKYLKNHGSSAIITQGYGLSEALAAVTLCYPGAQKSGSIGIPLAGNYVKIINSNREELPFGEIGEIVIHSKALMMGYLNNEAETNETLQIHDDGHIWLHTGDLGYMDEDGFIYYKGRSKRMIITSGYNVYPSHVEDIIESHPDVLQCTVVGIPHPYKQEVCKAFIVLKDGKHNIFVKASVKDYCKKNLAKYMIPQEYVFRKQLPKTKLGKVDFKTLQEDKGEDDDEE